MKASQRQIGTLKYIADHDVLVQHLRSVHQTTLWSLLYKGYVKHIGNRVLLTTAGQDMLDSYMRAKPSFRQEEDELSDRCRRMLHVAQMSFRKAS